MGNLIAGLDVKLRDKSWHTETADTLNFDEYNAKEKIAYLWRIG